MAAWKFRQRFYQSTLATLGLMSCSAVLVHLANGLIEMHFHYFVMVGVITFYQRRAPFVVGVGYVLLEHSIVGVIAPGAVYGTTAEARQPLLWAGIHGAFILAASAAHLLAWHANEQQAQTDPLTGLPNRGCLVDRLDAARPAVGSGRRYSLALINLDRFRTINEIYGHAAGDRCLYLLGRRLRHDLSGGDFIARVGGDELAVLYEVTGTDPHVMTDRVMRSIGLPLHVDGRMTILSASIGLLELALPFDPEEALREADLAMSLAKARGGGRVEVYRTSLGEAALEHLALEAALRLAIDEERIELHFQPVIDLATGKVHGAEALARWTDDERGPVPPSVFIPIAEASGLMVKLGQQLLRRGCEVASKLAFPFPGFVVNVNVSPAQLAQPDFVDDVLEALSSTGAPPGSLTLELTESMLVDNLDRTRERLETLRDLGVRVAIDDFGTGYSSLSYLRHLPVDVVKIDKSFVDNIDSGVEVLRAVIELAHSLHLSVVAEGIEGDAQLAALQRMVCDYGQGHLFAPAVELTELLGVLGRSTTRARWWHNESITRTADIPVRTRPKGRPEAPPATSKALDVPVAR